MRKLIDTDAIADLNAIPDTMKNSFVAPDPMATPLWEIDNDALNPYEELSPIQTWAKMGDRPCFPKEGIILIQAKPKQGKSYSVYAAMIPLLTQKSFGSITPLERPELVLVFDMEMSKTTLINRVYKQVQTLGENGQRFIVFPMKAMNLEERLPFIEKKIKQYKPDIAVIDQSGQLVVDVNSHAETNTLTRSLDQMSIGRSVFVIIHENKSKEDNNARGSLGSYLQFAQCETYVASKSKGIFTLTPKEARDTDTEEAATFSYMIDADGYIQDCTQKEAEMREAERQKWINDFSRIFGDDSTLSHTEMTKRKMDFDNLSERAARNAIDNAAACGAIKKISNERKAPYKLNL